jgi:regulator of RNase E activity RraA
MTSGIEIHPRKNLARAHINAFTGLPTSVVSDVGGRLLGTTGLHPINRSAVTVCGNAVTVKVRAGDNLLIHKALQILEPGDVLVVDGEGDITRALVGEIMMTIAKTNGAVGFVIDGAIRDVEAFEEHQFPCWARGVNLRGPYKDGPGTINTAITVGGMLVNPGDIILGDSDGVVAITPSYAQEIAVLAKNKVKQEHEMIQSILNRSYNDSWVDETLNIKGIKNASN